MHRFVWDLHYPPPEADAFSFPIAAVPGEHAAAAPRPVGAAGPLHA